ncbi:MULTISPECIES: hypothetical protein, partial [unclassified Campylobacter]
MKALNKSRGSIVLAAMLFAVSSVSIANAVTKIDGAEEKTNPNRWQATTQPSEGTVIISGADDATGSPLTNRNVYGGYAENGENVLNNKIIIRDKAEWKHNNRSLQAAASTGTSTTTTGPRLANNNSIYITGGSTINSSMWAARVNDGSPASINYNTTIIEDSTITHTQLRGAILYPAKSTVDYNTLYVKNSTMFGSGDSFEITGGFAQDVPTSENKADLVGTASYNQLIYDGVTTYTGTTKKTTSKYLHAGVARQGEANNNRIYVRDLNKDADDSAIATNVVGGDTWRPKSGGAEGNIAVAVGESKIANIYGGAVGFKADDRVTNISKGANKNLVILDLSGDGKVTENVYGGYIFDTSLGTTTGNAVYFLNGNVGGAVVGGNKEKTENTLILGNSTSTWGTRKAGQISNFENLNFNVLQ